jgi:hypothetical protein
VEFSARALATPLDEFTVSTIVQGVVGDIGTLETPRVTSPEIFLES